MPASDIDRVQCVFSNNSEVSLIVETDDCPKENPTNSTYGTSRLPQDVFVMSSRLPT